MSALLIKIGAGLFVLGLFGLPLVILIGFIVTSIPVGVWIFLFAFTILVTLCAIGS